jgi:hypothetical protein
MLPVEDGSQLVTICHQLKIENEIIHNDDDGQLLNITYKFD